MDWKMENFVLDIAKSYAVYHHRVPSQPFRELVDG